MDKTQVKQTYKIFSKLQFVTIKSYIKGMQLLYIYSPNKELMMNIHKNGRKTFL